MRKGTYVLPFCLHGSGVSLVQREENQFIRKSSLNYTFLREAFYRYQAKPRLSHFGEIYYEGKEKYVSADSFRPGILSDRLKEALGMGRKGSVPPP